MRVNGYISDLFFNTEHHASRDNKGQFVEHDRLETEGQDFLDCLEHLGVGVPDLGDLILDFLARL